jgi:hypothetical protein
MIFSSPAPPLDPEHAAAVDCAPVYRAPWDDPAPADADGPASPPPSSEVAPKPRGRRPNVARIGTGERPHWRYHHLTVSGPADVAADFSRMARGAGVIPWRFDGARFEEDVFHRAAAVPAAQRGLSIAGCHILARQFRGLVEAQQARAAAQVGHRQNCPFDLHTLLPVPGAILVLGPTHPDALAWLQDNWGVTDRLRQVAPRPGATAGRRLPRGHAVVGYGFFTADETPHAAIARIAARWPALRLWLLPRPAD